MLAFAFPSVVRRTSIEYVERRALDGGESDARMRTARKSALDMRNKAQHIGIIYRTLSLYTVLCMVYLVPTQKPPGPVYIHGVYACVHNIFP